MPLRLMAFLILILCAQARAVTDLYGSPLPEGAVARLGSTVLTHGGSVTCVAVSPDGSVIASSAKRSDDPDLIRLWDATSARLLRTLSGHTDDVYAIAFSPDGSVLASASADKTVRLWDWKSGKELRQFQAHRCGVRCLAFSADGKRLAAGGGYWENEVRWNDINEGVIHIWDLTRGEPVMELHGGEFQVRCLAFSPDGNFLASGSGYSEVASRHDVQPDPLARLWDLKTGKLAMTFGPHQLGVRGVAFSPDGHTLYTADDHGARAWDVAGGTVLRSFQLDKDQSSEGFMLSRDGGTLAIGTAAGAGGPAVFLFDISTARPPRRIPQAAAIKSVAFSPDGATVVCGGNEKRVRIYDVATGAERHPTPPQAPILSLAWSPDGRSIATGHQDNLARLWNASTGESLGTYTGQEHYVEAITFSPNGKLLATAGYMSKKLVVFDVQSGNQLVKDEADGDRATVLSFSPDGRTLATGGGGFAITLWDTSAWHKTQIKLEPRGFGFTFTPDGQFLVCEGRQCYRFLDPQTGKEVSRIKLEGESASRFSFSPDGRMIAAARGKELVVWEVASGKPRDKWTADSTYGPNVAFAPDGRTIAATGQDRVVRVFDLPTGKELVSFRGTRGWTYGLAFSPDGARLASGGDDNTALVWNTSHLRQPPAATTLAAADLDRLWAQLANEDAAAAYHAVIALENDRAHAVPFLQQKLIETFQVDRQQVDQLLAALDSDTFAARKKAMAALAQMGEAAEKTLRSALASHPTPQLETALRTILAQIQTDRQPARELGALRGLETLEHCGGPDAGAAIERIVHEWPDGRLKEAAKQAHARLTTR